MPSSERHFRPLIAVPALLAVLLFSAQATASPAGGGIRPATQAGAVTPALATLNNPGAQTGIVGTPVNVVLTGTEMNAMTVVKPLPAGLVLEGPKNGETEWLIVKTPEAPGVTEVELQAENVAKEKAIPVKFTFTVYGITKPAPYRSVTGKAVEIPVTGEGLTTLTAKSLPEGLKLEDTGGETAWTIVGTPTKPFAGEIELQGKHGAEALPPVAFGLTIAGIDQPALPRGTVGVGLRVAITGVELKTLTADQLPPGLELKDVEASETEWEIVGTPTAAGVTPVELKANAAEASPPLPVTLEFTIAEAPAAPTAAGQLTVTPTAAFAAAKSTCSGLSWSPASVATQWLLDGAPIAGATAATFVAPRIDDGHVLSCRQTATGVNGVVAARTSTGVTVHEQPAQPGWPIGPASQHCATPVCMEDGATAQTPPTNTYQQGGSWLAASQVRCVSAPWTSVAGTSGLAAVEGLAEAHAVTVTLQRITPAGAVTVASQELGSLAAPSDAVEGSLTGSPFAGNIATSYGGQAFATGELWPRMFKSSLGLPDRFVAGQGYLAYQLAATTGVRRSFQLVYNLTAADLGGHLRCVVQAKDGPVGAPTSASFTSPEYTVAASRACAPRAVAHIGGPQPAVVAAGSRRCLAAPAGLAEIGGSVAGVSVVAGRSSVLLECALAAGCRGKLTLAGGGRTLASVKVSLARGKRGLVSLKLTPQGRSLVGRAGGGGLAANLGLAGGGATRRLGSLRLIQVA